MDLRGKVGIVTGAGQGIGEASALRLVEGGAAVACVDIDPDSVARTASKIEVAGERAIAIRADVSIPEDNERMVADTLREFGALDFVHANAGITLMGRLDRMDVADWDRLYATNLRSVYLGFVQALPHLRRRGGGSFVITASVLGIVGDPDLPAYGATKGGLRSLCRSLAVAYGPDNIRVNAVCPGDVETPGLQAFLEYQSDPVEARERFTAHYPLGRFARPRDVANAVAFLISDDASYLTGIDLVVDGGLLANVY